MRALTVIPYGRYGHSKRFRSVHPGAVNLKSQGVFIPGLRVKIFELEVFGPQNVQFECFNILGLSKSKLLASSQPDRWPQDIKIFELEVFGSQNVQFEGFNILGLFKSKLLAPSQPDRWPQDINKN